jgi:hypothetical protein
VRAAEMSASRMVSPARTATSAWAYGSVAASCRSKKASYTVTDRTAPRRIGTAGIIRTAPALTREHFLGIRRTVLCGTMVRACVLRQADGAVELLSRQSEIAIGKRMPGFSIGDRSLDQSILLRNCSA